MINPVSYNHDLSQNDLTKQNNLNLSALLFVALKELVEKYQKIFLYNMPTGSGLPKAPRRTSDNFKITTGDQVKGDSTINAVIQQLQRRCNELESSLTLALNAPTVTPAIQRLLDLHWVLLRQAHGELDSTPGAQPWQKHTLYEEYEMNLLRENDAPKLGTSANQHS